MVRLHGLCVFSLLLLVSGASSPAATILMANLTNTQEVPPGVPTTSTGQPRPASFGNATFVLNDDMTALSMSVTVFNIDFTGLQTPDLNDNLLNAHIHASATAAPGANAPVVWGFFGMPFNDNAPNDVVVTPFTTGVGGTITGKWDFNEGNNTTLAAQLSNILSGHSYINFHTVQFTGGEVRGFLEVVSPEPSTITLLSAAFLCLAGTAIRKRG